MLRDLIYGLRGLRRNLTLSVSAVVALALGIGLNAATLSVLDTLLLRAPAQVRDPGSLRRLYSAPPVPSGKDLGGPQGAAISSWSSWAE